MIKNRAEFKGWFIFVLITYQIIRNFGIFSQQFCAENKPTFKFGTGMRETIRIFFLICGIFSALPVYAADIPAARELLSSIDISNSDNIAPEILAAYQALEQSVQDAENLNRQYQADLQENADAMHETEQSFENRMLGGAAMATTGIGAMQLGAAMAEQSADAAAQRDMSAYLATFRCDYGAGANIQGGETNITLPGANTLLTLRTEYMDLAADIKIRKESLGLPPGIESETILDATQHNLYNNESIGITDGAYASVSRALTNTGGDDATEWAAMKSETAEQLKSGAIAAGIGAVGSAVANMVINKDAPQERSREITNEYNSNLQAIESEIDENQSALLTAIDENEQRIAEYNELLNQHNEFIETITPECQDGFSEYITVVNSAEPITDNLIDVKTLPLYEYDLDDLETALAVCIDGADALTNMSYMSTGTNSKPICTQFIAPYDRKVSNNNADWCLSVCMFEVLGGANCTVTDANLGENGQCICNPGVLTDNDTVPLMYRVCDGVVPDGVNGICEDEFFRDKRIHILAAVALAKEWALLKHNDNITCNETPRRCKKNLIANGDCLQCKSVDNNTYYEFLFGKASAYGDSNIEEGVLSSICKLYGMPYTKSGSYETALGGIYVYPAYCQTKDENLCQQINITAEKFGRSAKIDTFNVDVGTEYTACAMVENKFLEYSEEAERLKAIRTAFGIDNEYPVKYGLQTIMNNRTIEFLRNFSEMQMRENGITLTSFECLNDYVSYSDKYTHEIEDILTCYVNGEPVDFVFDDLSEGKQKELNSANEYMDCINHQGVYTGRSCFGLQVEQCNNLIATNKETCPECSGIMWDPVNNLCLLPDSSKKINRDRATELAKIAAGGAAGIGLILTSKGIGWKEGVAIVFEVVATAVSTYFETEMQKVVDEFSSEANSCHDAECAKSLIGQYLQRLANLSDHLQGIEVTAADEIMAHLAEYIPDDDPFFGQYDSLSISDNQLSVFDADSWEPEQVWQSVTDGLMVIGPTVYAGLTKLVGVVKSSPKFMPATTKIFKKKISTNLAKRSVARNASRGVEQAEDLWLYGFDWSDAYDAKILRGGKGFHDNMSYIFNNGSLSEKYINIKGLTQSELTDMERLLKLSGRKKLTTRTFENGDTIIEISAKGEGRVLADKTLDIVNQNEDVKALTEPLKRSGNYTAGSTYDLTGATRAMAEEAEAISEYYMGLVGEEQFRNLTGIDG